MEIQQGIAFELTQARIGKPLEVILDAEVQGEQNVWVGRSKSDAPDVDSLVFVTGGDAPLSAGDIVRCEAVTAQGYDLIAVPIE